MKRLLTILFVCLCCSVFGAKAQTNLPDGTLLKDVLRSVVDAPSSEEYLDAIYNQLASTTPRYKVYKTSHEYISLKLDTATGRVWMVRIGMGDKSSRKVLSVDDTSPLRPEDSAFNGRFELYPTNNSYNFILIDTCDGTTYQVQWHTESNKRFRKLIE